MKKYISIFLFSSIILFACHAFAGNTALTTYYPAPTAAYNKVKLSATAPITSAAAYCTGNNGAIFVDSIGNLNQCTAVAGGSTPYCAGVPSGALITDSNGTLHVCNNGASSIYPQQCYNSFCSYDNVADPGGVATCLASGKPSCQLGFNNQGFTDTFKTSPKTTVISIACCSS